MNMENPEPEGLRLRTLIDIAFSGHVNSYAERQKIIDGIFARLEEQQLGDWITEDTGRKYELTFIPKDRGYMQFRTEAIVDKLID